MSARQKNKQEKGNTMAKYKENYKIDSGDNSAVIMEKRIKKGYEDLPNKRGDAAFRVWCHLVVNTENVYDKWLLAIHMSENSIDMGLDILINEGWISIVEDTIIINMIRKG